jgi:hypothetical protein
MDTWIGIAERTTLARVVRPSRAMRPASQVGSRSATTSIRGCRSAFLSLCDAKVFTRELCQLAREQTLHQVNIILRTPYRGEHLILRYNCFPFWKRNGAFSAVCCDQVRSMATRVWVPCKYKKARRKKRRNYMYILQH